jgi:hypothetical protein
LFLGVQSAHFSYYSDKGGEKFDGVTDPDAFRRAVVFDSSGADLIGLALGETHLHIFETRADVLSTPFAFNQPNRLLD